MSDTPTPPPIPTVHKFGGTSLADGARIGGAADLVVREGTPAVVVVSAMAGVTNTLLDVANHLSAAAPGEGSGGAVELALEALAARHRSALDALADPPRAADGPEAAAKDRARTAARVDGCRSEIEAILDRLRTTCEGWRAEPTDSSERPETSGVGRSAAEIRDRVMAAGEDLSAHLTACALRARGHHAVVVDARSVVRTDAAFGRARPQPGAIRALADERIRPLIDSGTTVVVQGFVGAAPDGRTTTLGRGGSDYTAALLAAALGSEVVHIWTDVDGVFSCDPRAVDEPSILPEIGFEEAVELSYFGAKVLHPGAAKHAVSTGVRVRIRNAFNPDHPGTVILSDRRGTAEVAAVAFKAGVTLIKVRSHPSAMPYGFLARVFEILARHRLPVDLVATSHSSTAFTIDENEELAEVCAELSHFAEVEVVTDLATVTVVGHGLLEEPGTDALVFWAVERTPVHLISQASDVSLSFVVDQTHAAPLVRRLHTTLIEFRAEERARRKWGIPS